MSMYPGTAAMHRAEEGGFNDMSEEMVINPAAEAEEEERLHEQVKVRRDKLAALC